MNGLKKALLILMVLALSPLAGGMSARAHDIGLEGAAPSPMLPQEEEKGLVILSVVKGSPAAEAGIERGDILLAVDGKPVKSLHALAKMLFCHEPGDAVNLLIRHGDEERTVKVVLGERKLWPGEEGPYLGLQFCPCPAFSPLGFPFEVPEITVEPLWPPGAMVLEVEEDSPAEKAGLKPGDIILALDGQELDEEHPLPRLIRSRRPGDEVELKVWRKGEELTVRLKLGERGGKAYLGVFYIPPFYGPFFWGWSWIGPKMKYYFAPGEGYFPPEMFWPPEAPEGEKGLPPSPLPEVGSEGGII